MMKRFVRGLNGQPGELLMDFLASLLLSIGFTEALFTFSDLSRTLSAPVLSAFLDTLFLLVFTRNRRTALLLSAGILCVPLGALLFRKLDLLSGFFLWWASGLPRMEPFTGNAAFLLLVRMLAALPVAAFCWLMVRKLFSFPVLFLISFAAVLSLWIFRRDASAVLCFLAAGLIILLPRVHYRTMERSPDFDAREIPRGSLQLLAVPAAAACVLLTLLILPEDTSTWKFQPLLNLIADVGDMARYHFGKAGAPGYREFEIADAGFQPYGDRLGGAISPDNASVLTYRGNFPILLKGRVQDTYTGSSWTDSGGKGRFRYNSLLWRIRRDEVFPDSPAGGRKARDLYDRLTRTVSAEIHYQTSGSGTLFYNGSPRRIQLAGERPPALYFNTASELFTNSAISGYQLETRIIDRTQPHFDENFAKLEALAASHTDRTETAVQEHYLQLPSELPEQVRQTAASITEGAETPFAKARRIEDWLQENCTYTLSPPEPSEGDFVQQFLEEREGYCVYYATAMTVLARCEGIPARYVTGYGLRLPTESASEVFRASNQTAHAWSELYFHGIGWTPFDPLRWNAGNVLPADPLPEPSASSAPVPQPSEHTSPVPETFASPPEAAASWIPLLIALVLIAACAVVLRLIYRRLLSRIDRLYALESVSRRARSPQEILETYYRDFLKQFQFYGLSIAPGETLNTFAEHVDSRIRSDTGELSFAPIAAALTAWRFGKIPPEPGLLNLLSNYHSFLEARIRASLEGPRYLFRRILPSFAARPPRNR